MTEKQITKALLKNGFNLDSILEIRKDQITVAVNYELYDYFGETKSRVDWKKTKTLANKIVKSFLQNSKTTNITTSQISGVISIYFNHERCPYVFNNID